MADTRVPVQTIDQLNSFPFGRGKCIVVKKIADGTAKVGYACKIDTTDTNKIVLATAGIEYGVVAAGNGLKHGDTPTAGTLVEVIVWGPCVARVAAGGDNIVGGSKQFCAHASTGVFIPVVGTGGSATSSSADLLDARAGSTEAYCVILFKGIQFNSNTHS